MEANGGKIEEVQSLRHMFRAHGQVLDLQTSIQDQMVGISPPPCAPHSVPFALSLGWGTIERHSLVRISDGGFPD